MILAVPLDERQPNNGRITKATDAILPLLLCLYIQQS